MICICCRFDYSYEKINLLNLILLLYKFMDYVLGQMHLVLLLR